MDELPDKGFVRMITYSCSRTIGHNGVQGNGLATSVLPMGGAAPNWVVTFAVLTFVPVLAK